MYSPVTPQTIRPGVGRIKPVMGDPRDRGGENGGGIGRVKNEKTRKVERGEIERQDGKKSGRCDTQVTRYPFLLDLCAASRQSETPFPMGNLSATHSHLRFKRALDIACTRDKCDFDPISI